MSDVNLTIYDCDDDGIGNLTDNAVTINTANDYYFLNNGACKVYVENTTGVTVTMTIETPNTVAGLAIADKDVTLATGKADLFGPFAPGAFNDQDRKVHLTFDQAVDVVVVRG